MKAELEDARLALIKNGLTNDQIKKLVDQAQAEVKAETTSVIRLYNPTTDFHWFTTDSGRASTMRANGWNLEGVAFNAPVTGVPVFAVSNPNTGLHFFTSNSEEAAGLVAKGWNLEGHAYYVAK